VETLFASLKVERLHGLRFETRRRAKDEAIDWLGFYNRKEIYSTLGYTGPMTFEKTWRCHRARGRHNLLAVGGVAHG